MIPSSTPSLVITETVRLLAINDDLGRSSGHHALPFEFHRAHESTLGRGDRDYEPRVLITDLAKSEPSSPSACLSVPDVTQIASRGPWL